MADVEFAIVVEERTVYVHLHDEGTSLICFYLLFSIRWGLALLLGRFYDCVQLVYFVNYGYPTTLVCVFSWFYDPDISGFYWF